MDEGYLCHTRDLLGWRHIPGIVLVHARLGELGLDVGCLHHFVFGDLGVGETRTMSQKVLHGDRLGRRYIRVGGLAIGACACHAHLHVFEGRQEFGDGIGELDDTIFDQHHGRYRDKRLGH